MASLSPPPLSTPMTEDNGTPTFSWGKWFNQLQTTIVGAIHPLTPALKTQAGAIYQGSGVPSNADGSNGDFYFRTDTPGTLNQRLYVKSGGAWVGIS